MPDTSIPTAVQTAHDLTVKATIRKLTPAQRHTLGRILMGDDSMVNKRMARVLERKGLVFPFEVRLGGGGFPLVVTHYGYPIHVHIAYCQWASEQPVESDA